MDEYIEVFVIISNSQTSEVLENLVVRYYPPVGADYDEERTARRIATLLNDDPRILVEER